MHKRHKLKSFIAVAALGMVLTSGNTITALADTPWNISNGSISTTDGETYIITGKTEENSLNNILVQGGNVRIILDNVDINLSDWVEALSINSGANVNLVLRGNNKITSGWGIIVTYGSTLNISGDGSLTVLARNSSAIGNILYDSRGMGNINIQSGTLDLKSESGCGIGSAISKDGIGKIGDITISGGTIKAVGSTECAGIGSANGSSLGNVYIGGDSTVEASSIQGAGIGTGLSDKETDSVLGSIVIGGESKVKSVSYSGAGIGTGDMQEKSTNIVVKDNAEVYAESYLANSIGDGNTSATDSTVQIADSTDVVLISYRGDTLPDTNNANITEIKLESALTSDTELEVEGRNKVSNITAPKDAYSVATNVKDGEIKGTGAIVKNTSQSGGVTKKEVMLATPVSSSIIYVSSTGNDKNDGLTNTTAVRTFEKAYELVDTNGTIVVCGGNININRVARLNKTITVKDTDGTYGYNKFNPSVTIASSNNSLYDKLNINGVKTILKGNYTSNNFKNNIKISDSSIVRVRESILGKLLNCNKKSFTFRAELNKNSHMSDSKILAYNIRNASLDSML